MYDDAIFIFIFMSLSSVYCINRRLEDPDSEEVKEFVQKQVELTEKVLKKCETREKLRDNLTKLFDYPRYDVPFRRGDKYFYFHNSGLQPQRVLYMQVCFLIVSLLVEFGVWIKFKLDIEVKYGLQNSSSNHKLG